MRVSQTFPEAKRKAVADLEITKLYYLAEIPEEKRDKFIADHELSGMTTRDIKRLARETKGIEDYRLFTDEDYRRMREIIKTTTDMKEAEYFHRFLIEMYHGLLECVSILENKIAVLTVQEEC